MQNRIYATPYELFKVHHVEVITAHQQVICEKGLLYLHVQISQALEVASIATPITMFRCIGDLSQDGLTFSHISYKLPMHIFWEEC